MHPLSNSTQDINIDLQRREMTWKYEDEEFKLGDILIDSSDVYEDTMRVGGGRTMVYIA